MTESDGDLARRVAILADVLAHIEGAEEAEADPSHRPPSAGELRRVATEVTIPAAVAVLETNARVLELLDERTDDGWTNDARTDDAADRPGRPETRVEEGDRVDDAEREPAHGEEVARILQRAADLQADVEAHLEAARAATGAEDAALEHDPIPVDVEAELEAIRRDVGDRAGTGEGAPEEDGHDEGSDAGT